MFREGVKVRTGPGFTWGDTARADVAETSSAAATIEAGNHESLRTDFPRLPTGSPQTFDRGKGYRTGVHCQAPRCGG